jgi:subtilisin family serine protease/regulation of enolase protein 1 (concanavalin A-like superfamily)
MKHISIFTAIERQANIPWQRWAMLALLIASCTWATSLGAQPQFHAAEAGPEQYQQPTPATADAASDLLQVYRYHFDKALPMTVDPTKIALLQDEAAGAKAQLEGFPQLGIRPGAVTAHAVRGWSLVVIEPDLLDRMGGLKALVDAFAKLPETTFASPVFIDDLGGPMFLTPRILFSFHEGIAAEVQGRLLEKGAFKLEKDYAALGVKLARIAPEVRNGFELLARVNTLAQSQETLFAEPDVVFTGRSSLIPNDPRFDEQWALRNTGQLGGTVGIDMRATQAWDITIGDPSIITVIIDTGVEQDHPDINQVAGTDVTSDASTTGDPVNQFDNHGTPVAGCVSATINNNVGIAGVAPGTRSASARTMIATNAQGSWSSSASWSVDALDWATSINARVTNNSNAYGFTSAAVETSYTNTRNAGMVHFASAGNDASNALSYPSSLATVNAVSAVNRNGNLAGFSNFNTGMSVSAPGAAVLSTDRTGNDGYAAGDYASVNGTSFASPYAAGVAALVLSVDPSLTAAEVEDILQQTALDLGTPGFDIQFGFGMVNAFAAVSCIKSTVDLQTSNVGNPGSGNAYALNSCSTPNTYNISAGAANNSMNTDNLAFIHQEFCGDFHITVKVDAVSSNGWAGLLARESTAAGSRMVGAYSNLGSIVRWESRAATNGNKAINLFSRPFPYWLRLIRQGNTFLGYYSVNGTNYSLISIQVLPLNACLEVGMAAFSSLPGQTIAASFSNLSYGSGVMPLMVMPQQSVMPAGIDRQAATPRLFPNPASDQVTLEFPGQTWMLGDEAFLPGAATLRLRNELGQLFEERRLDELPERLEWDVNLLTPGMYFIEVHTEGAQPQMLRFVKGR